MNFISKLIETLVEVHHLQVLCQVFMSLDYFSIEALPEKNLSVAFSTFLLKFCFHHLNSIILTSTTSSASL